MSLGRNLSQKIICTEWVLSRVRRIPRRVFGTELCACRDGCDRGSKRNLYTSLIFIAMDPNTVPDSRIASFARQVACFNLSLKRDTSNARSRTLRVLFSCALARFCRKVDDVIELKYRSSADKPRRADHGGNRPDGSIDAVYVLEHSHSTTYYHFLIEALPRLEHLWHTVSDNEGVKIFQISSFASTTFTLLGLGSNRACDDRFTVYPRVLLPPPTTDPRDAATVARLKSMSSRLVAAAGMAEVTPEDKPTWLVINRAGAKQRRIVNHEELMLGLREAFPSITFREFGGGDGVAGEGEGMKYLRPADGVAGAKGLNNTRRDQEERNEGGIEHSLRQFRSCWGVIAPHGAGLSNIVFIARSNASVVEIVGKGQAGRVYEALAGQFGHRHAYVTAPHVTWRHVHMEVNVSAVVNTVMQFMS